MRIQLLSPTYKIWNALSPFSIPNVGSLEIHKAKSGFFHTLEFRIFVSNREFGILNQQKPKAIPGLPNKLNSYKKKKMQTPFKVLET